MKIQEGLKTGTLTMVCSIAAAGFFTLCSLSLLSLGLMHFDLADRPVSILLIAVGTLACFGAGFLAGRKMKRRRFLWGFFAGLLYFILLYSLKVWIGEAPLPDSPHFITSLLYCCGSGMLGGMLS